MPANAEQRRGLGGLLDAERGERVEVGVGVLRALVARVVMSTHTSVPASAQRASVPPAEISGSSGWA